MSRLLTEPNPQPIKGLLAMRRITIRSAGKSASVSERYLGDVINGRVIPSKKLTGRLAELLEVPVDELFRLDDNGRVTP